MNMEHDFRTPLANISSASEVLLMSKKERSEDEKYFISAMAQCANELRDYFVLVFED